MITNLSRSAAAFGMSALLCAGLAACSGSGGANAAPDHNATSAGVPGSSSPVATSSVAASGSACGLVTVSEVATASAMRNTGSPEDRTCIGPTAARPSPDARPSFPPRDWPHRSRASRWPRDRMAEASAVTPRRRTRAWSSTSRSIPTPRAWPCLSKQKLAASTSTGWVVTRSGPSRGTCSCRRAAGVSASTCRHWPSLAPRRRRRSWHSPLPRCRDSEPGNSGRRDKTSQ